MLYSASSVTMKAKIENCSINIAYTPSQQLYLYMTYSTYNTVQIRQPWDFC